MFCTWTCPAQVTQKQGGKEGAGTPGVRGAGPDDGFWVGADWKHLAFFQQADWRTPEPHREIETKES